MTETQKVIELRDVSFNYNGNVVLDGISFSIARGEYLGIIGPNGGGKTTLVRIMLGLVEPDTGEVLLYGRPVREFRSRSMIGYVPQRAAHEEFYFPATVEEVVRSGRTARAGLLRKLGKDDEQAIELAIETADIVSIRKRLIGELSGGERQRVFIARALAGEPNILILDEPVVGVDITSKDSFYAFLKHLNHDNGITIVFVSHDVGVIAQEVGSIMCLNRSLICHGPPKQYIKEEFLEQVYGKKVSSILHEH
jgi:zinc transport system ATP-binding protein